MTGRERMKAALHYQPVDRAPLQYYYTPVDYYEHGEKLNDLFAKLPGDFEPFRRQEIPILSKECFDAAGNYHVFRRNEWGTLFEYRIFGIAGLPCEYPLKDISRLNEYTLPPKACLRGAPFETVCRQVREAQREYYTVLGAGNLFEKMKELRPDEDVLCDLALDEPEIHALADLIVEYDSANVQLAVMAGADGITFGDDYGSERAMLLNPKLWRQFFKPRLKTLFQPAVDAGLDVLFHSCGMILPILEDLKEIGVTSIWPQLPLFEMDSFARHCHELQLAVAIHTDRANTMTYGTPDQVRSLVEREYETFRMADGGSWFYVEADNGFPYENIEALVHAISQWR